MRDRPRLTRLLAVSATVLLLATAGCTSKRYWGSATTSGGQAKIGLVTKTESNPYFVAMRKAAEDEANKRGATLYALAGKFDGDNEGQVTAIENLIQRGVNTILITPSTATGAVGAIREARERGIMVLALDSETSPKSAVDATFATDNYKAGQKQGRYLRAASGGGQQPALMLDGTDGSTVNTQRRTGFLNGFGLTEQSPNILGHQSTNGDQNKAQQATENLLQRNDSAKVVYTMNEAISRGVVAALGSRGLLNQVTLGTIDGGCSGVDRIADGSVNVDVMQFPAKMSRLGVDAGVRFAKTGKKPTGFLDTGSEPIAAKPVDGMATKDPNWGRQHCWSDK